MVHSGYGLPRPDDNGRISPVPRHPDPESGHGVGRGARPGQFTGARADGIG